MAEQVPSARRRELGARLRAARLAAGFATMEEVTVRLGWSPAKHSRMESGKRPVDLRAVTLLLGLCQTLAEQRADILELAEADENGCWVRPHDGRMPEAVPSVVFQQNTADSITFYDPVGLPAVLHTTEYAELDLLPRFATDADAMPHLHARLERNSLVHKADGPEVVFFLHEAALRTLPVDDAARTGQLRCLAMLNGRDRIRIRVVPAGQNRTFAVGGFQLLRFAEFAPVVCAPHETVTLLLEGQHLPAYEAILARLDEIALSEQDSADLITRLAGPQPAERGLSVVPRPLEGTG